MKEGFDQAAAAVEHSDRETLIECTRLILLPFRLGAQRQPVEIESKFKCVCSASFLFVCQCLNSRAAC